MYLAVTHFYIGSHWATPCLHWAGGKPTAREVDVRAMRRLEVDQPCLVVAARFRRLTSRPRPRRRQVCRAPPQRPASAVEHRSESARVTTWSARRGRRDAARGESRRSAVLTARRGRRRTATVADETTKRRSDRERRARGGGEKERPRTTRVRGGGDDDLAVHDCGVLARDRTVLEHDVTELLLLSEDEERPLAELFVSFPRAHTVYRAPRAPPPPR